MRKILFSLLVVVFYTITSAQEINVELFEKNPDAAGSIYYTYHFQPGNITPVPAGYEPIYISHYGRHGSRWHASKHIYHDSRNTFTEARKRNMLTEYGKKICDIVLGIVERAEGRCGELSVQGNNEHKGIAQRMYNNFPALFKDGDHILCRSTLAPRCIISMSTFSEKLKENNPKLDIFRFTNDNTQRILIPSHGRKWADKAAKEAADPAIDRAIWSFRNDVLPKLFKEEFCREADQREEYFTAFLHSLYYISMVAQDTEGDLRLHELWTAEQRFEAWKAISAQRYATFANSEEWGDAIQYDGSIILQDFVDDADDFLKNRSRTASLRFGHDVTVLAMLSAMLIEGRSARTSWADPELMHKWADFKITPMATNIQWIFYENKSGDILVKLLHNEQEVTIPVKSKTAPYYTWKELRRYCTSRIAEINNYPVVAEIEKYNKIRKKTKGERADR